MVETTMSQKKGRTRRHYTTELRNGPKHFFSFHRKLEMSNYKEAKIFKANLKENFRL